MTFDECLAAGRNMDERETEKAIRLLATEPERFAALLVLMERMRQTYAREGSSKGAADFHGRLAHSGGGVHALQALEDRLRGMIEGKQVRRPQGPAEEE